MLASSSVLLGDLGLSLHCAYLALPEFSRQRLTTVVGFSWDVTVAFWDFYNLFRSPKV